ncbi:MAG: 3-hydroxyacyl-ACP dehydratase [Mucilaginibacter sp.]|jgi:3-hydroxyacyl-[acyl-carrier-protein] dehydratase|nr:3-hydroxyacyl-ACP dehydratase [Mucilaginibacter sp.]
MLQNDFFTFTELQTEGNIVKTNIELNASHPIFKGHFPDQPVLPGVCMLQMVKEIVEVYINKETKLVKASDLKFLSFIFPDQNKLIQMELKLNIENEWIKADARLLDNAIVLFKFKGTFVGK